MERDSIGLILTLLGAVLSVVIAWYLFEIAIQPALVSISPVFSDQALHSTGRVGRTPDNLAQIALFATLLTGLYIFYILQLLVYGGIDEVIGALKATILIISLPILIINGFLPEKFKFIDEG
jgi:hypothetical protein